MKIQLDTDNKTIKLESNVELNELIKTLEKLLPKELWKEFTLETNVVINNWSNPIIIEKSRPPYPYYPWYCDKNSTIPNNKHYCLNKGTYNLEC